MVSPIWYWVSRYWERKWNSKAKLWNTYLHLDFTQFRISMIYIDKERHLHDWLMFFPRRTLGVCLDGRVWGDGQLPMGGYQYVRWSLFYNYQYHDINISGSHFFVIIFYIIFIIINMSGGHSFVIKSDIILNITISICQVWSGHYFVIISNITFIIMI